MLDRERIKIFGDLPGLRPKKGDYFTDRNLLFTFQKFRGYLDRVTMTDTMTFHSLPTYSCRIFVEAVGGPFSNWGVQLPINRGISSNSMATR